MLELTKTILVGSYFIATALILLIVILASFKNPKP